jgi:hypothetical protein
MSLNPGSERFIDNRHIREAEFDGADFGITRQSDVPGMKYQPGIATVMVTHKPTDTTRQHRGAVYPPPFLEFERDLKADRDKAQ